MTTLSVVVPVYNERARIGQTLAAVADAVGETPFELELVVVDDGSTDGSGDAARAAGAQVLKQGNAGRFAARRAGLEHARGELVLLLDSRVRLVPGSLGFAAERVAAGEPVWNAHVHVDTTTPYGRFWHVLTELAFADYFADPRTTSFGPEEFDRFPKGTTCFLAPAELLRDVFAGHETYYGDARNANDDTPILRRLVERERINISPSFAALYVPRTTLRGFLRHALHRGVVFLDGHGRRASRFFPVVVAFYPASVGLVAAAVLWPLLVPLGLVAVAGAAGAVALLKRRPVRETVAFAALAPLYALAHGLGMWKGALLALAGRRR
jgi:glycosyltransferase involved in cell wall biosynthesis